MPKFTVWKEMCFSIEIEAETAQDALNDMLNMDDLDMGLDACDHGVWDEEGNEIDLDGEEE